MELLKDFNLDGISLSILKENKEGLTLRGLTLRILNKSANFTTSLYGTRYISKKKGILELQNTDPSHFYFDGESVLHDSFIDIFLTFQQGKIEEGDKIELKLSKVADLILAYHENEWLVQEYVSQCKIKEQLVSQVELLDIAFDKIGVSIQNVSVKVIDNNEFDLFYELTSNNFSPLKKNISVNITIYDMNNHIVAKDTDSYLANKFMGFEVTKTIINVPCSLSQIGRILLYPSII